MLLTIYYAAIGAQVPLADARLFFVLSIVAFVVFLMTGIIWAFRQIKRRLQPLTIMDEIYCTYLPKERQLVIDVTFLTYSNSTEYECSCMALFGNQSVSLNAESLMITSRVDARRRCFKCRQNDVAITDASSSLIKLRIKPSGFGWRWKHFEKNIPVNIVNH